MKILDKIMGKAETGKKKTAIVGALVLVGLVGLIAVVSGKGGQLSSLFSDKKEGRTVADTSGIQEPTRSADIAGIVESVSGNEVKIMLLNVSDLPGGNRTDGSKAGVAGGTTSANKTGGQRQRPADMPQGGQGGPTGSSGNAARTAMLAELKKKSIGEETIIVPVGIQMMKMGGGGRMEGAAEGGEAGSGADGEEQPGAGATMGGQQASITDITVDSTLRVWLNAGVTDKKVAEFVSIMG